MRESQIEAYLVKQIRAAGGEVRKVQFIGRRGAPDRFVMLETGLCVDGLWATHAWVELKATGKVAEPHQLREHRRLRAMGQPVIVIDSLAGVDKLMQGDGA